MLRDVRALFLVLYMHLFPVEMASWLDSCIEGKGVEGKLKQQRLLKLCAKWTANEPLSLDTFYIFQDEAYGLSISSKKENGKVSSLIKGVCVMV